MPHEAGTSSGCIDIELHRPWGKKKSSTSDLENPQPAEKPKKPSIPEEPELVGLETEPAEVLEPPSPTAQVESESQGNRKATPTETGTKPKDTPSIFNRKKERKEEEAEQVSVVDKKSREFGEEELQQAWKDFAAGRSNIGDTDKLILNRTLTKGTEHKVIIHLASQLEVSFLEKLEVDLIQFLRSALENDHITLERQVLQEEETKKLYTGKDIFEHMVKENPALKDLKDRLGLDFDY